MSEWIDRMDPSIYDEDTCTRCGELYSDHYGVRCKLGKDEVFSNEPAPLNDEGHPMTTPADRMREALERIARELHWYNPASDEHKGRHIHKVWSREILAALATHPEQAGQGAQNPRFTMDEWTAHARKHKWRFDLEPASDGVAAQAEEQAAPEKCRGCDGRGVVGGMLPNGGGYEDQECPVCEGSGGERAADNDGSECPWCGASGPGFCDSDQPSTYCDHDPHPPQAEQAAPEAGEPVADHIAGQHIVGNLYTTSDPNKVVFKRSWSFPGIDRLELPQPLKRPLG